MLYLLNKDKFECKDGRLHILDLQKENPSKIRLSPTEMFSIIAPAGEKDETDKNEFITWMKKFDLVGEKSDPFYLDNGKALQPKITTAIEAYLGQKLVLEKPVSNDFLSGRMDAVYEEDTKKSPVIEVKTFCTDKLFGYMHDGEWILERDPNTNKVLVDEPGVKIKEKDWALYKKRKGEVIFKGWQISPDKAEYMYQLQTYLYLTNKENGVFYVCFYGANDIYNIDNFQLRIGVDENCNLVPIEMTRDPEFVEKIETAKKWYDEHITTGISPLMTKQDMIWYESQVKQR